MANVQNIDLNFVSAEELMEAKIEGLSDSMARDLVAYRDESGPFDSWDEVGSIPGFDEPMVEKLKDSGVQLSTLSDQTSGTEESTGI